MTAQGLAFFGERFGLPFPQRKYDQVFVPDMGGAMENYGCVTWSDAFVYRSAPTHGEREQRAVVLLHEMAHMWFGDIVTMRWWDDLWLNEAFAEWACYWAADGGHRSSPTPGRASWPAASSPATAPTWRPTTHPIRQPVDDVAEAAASFDGITYPKGASVLKQLVAYVGEDAFVAGLRTYFAKHAWGNATLDDLIARARGRPAGVTSPAGRPAGSTRPAPTSCRSSASRRRARAARRRARRAARRARTGSTSASTTGPTTALVAARARRRSRSTGPQRRLHRGWRTAGPAAAQRRGPHLRLRPAGRGVAAPRWSSPPALLPRGDLAGGGGAPPRGTCSWSARLSAADFVRCATAVLRRRDRRQPWSSRSCGWRSRRPSTGRPTRSSDGLLAQVADTCLDLAQADGPRRQVAVRALAQTATTDEQLDALRELAGDDVDLRWRMLTRLAALGRLDLAELDALKAQDPDPDAWVRALAVEAARPDADAEGGRLAGGSSTTQGADGVAGASSPRRSGSRRRTRCWRRSSTGTPRRSRTCPAPG